LLANKESLVTGGRLVMGRAAALHKPVLPVDSEHSAIFQCLQARGGNPLRRLILTASGGPFRTWKKEDIQGATAAQALGHPTWKMGPKITVDCASMMNKGLEVIEAHHLFGMPLDQIDVVVHPQSVIHSMVEFEDGAVLAQLGVPDMRVPIGYAMGYPERIPFGGERLDFAKLSQMTFEAPDVDRFPCLKMAVEAQRSGGVMPVALNGANEAAVAAFLRDEIPFGGIARAVEAVLTRTPYRNVTCVEDVYEADEAARRVAREEIRKISGQ
ncbi:MAG: 1-deoxy-D-xylulose-5-phosphate reductoisomerase, partial [Clostridia bacterium]|nr:1-deoxy-D-xylulose-5-phosphate reductoisomerase [Clostridia bacterium]